MKSTSRNRVNYQQRFERYLEQYRRRYKFRYLAITAGAILFAAVAVTLLTAALGDSLAYSGWLYYPARVLLAVAVLAIIAVLFIKPSRRIADADGATELESTVPEFGGRADTYLDMKRRDARSPFVGLLAKDAANKAAAAPVRKLLPAADIAGPLVACAGLLVLCGWLFSAVPLEWRAGMQHFWFGWFKSDILPERSIALEPGDTKLRVGDSLAVAATLEGFESNFAKLHLRTRNDNGGNNDGEWQTVEMNRQLDGSFVFTMYGISDPLDYYVSSSFTNSEQATVEVVVPAKIDNIQLTYRYPAWTGREPQVVKSGNNIAAVENTEVDLLISTDKALTDGELLVDGVAGKLTAVDETTYSASLTVSANSTTYQLADLLGDDRIMLTPEYSITVTEDASPTISFTQPAGDFNATAIEEVTVVAKAADDFAVEEVKLHYSLNGGEWTTLALSSDNDFSHVFMLEEFKTEFNEPLLPGDLLTYYAEATDREQSTSTDIQFIDIRPFERRYTQSQQSGGGGGGGGQQEPPPGEISQRQKEILVATWNLIKEQEALAANSAQASGGGANTRSRSLRRRNTPQNQILQDNAALLSDLQSKLAEQAEKLAQRAEARQLMNDDPKIAQFVEYMQKAAKAMRPSAEQLGTQSLQEAVRHQQRALQFLRRGELLFNDITINQSQGNGSGNSAGRDMQEIYELEMDLAKNQYETPDAVQQRGGNENQPEDDALQKLKELAERQQQLAEAAAKKDELSMAEKWEQEKLRRELEELKRELEQLQRNASQNNESQSSEQQQSAQSEQSQQQGQQGQQSESQSNGQSNGQSSDGQQGSQSRQQAMQNLEQAIRDLQNAENNQGNDNPQQSLESASQRLQESLEQLQTERQQRLQQQLAEAASDVRDLTRQQQETAQQLRDAMQRAIEARNNNEFTSGLTPQQQQELAEQKREMQRDLEAVKEQLADAASRFSEDAPQTSEKLQQAIDQLDETKAAELMGIAGDMIEEGMAPQASLRERRVTEALQNLQQDLSEAGQLAAAEAGSPPDEEITAADASRSIQELRQALNQALEQANRGSGRQQQQLQRSGQQSSQQQGAQQGSQQQGSQGQSGQQGDQPQGSTPGGQPNSWGQNSGTLDDSEAPINGGQQQLLTEATTELERIASADIEGLSENTVSDMQELARQLRENSNSPENERRIDADVRLLLRQIEQLELQVYRERQGLSGVRSARTTTAPKGFNKRSADYFKRLSEEATGS